MKWYIKWALVLAGLVGVIILWSILFNNQGFRFMHIVMFIVMVALYFKFVGWCFGLEKESSLKQRICYVCEKCGYEYPSRRKVSPYCPKCQSRRIRKV